MANTRSASKRARQTTKRSLRNRRVLTRLRRMQKGVSPAGAKPEEKDVRAMISAIDKAASKITTRRRHGRRDQVSVHGQDRRTEQSKLVAEAARHLDAPCELAAVRSDGQGVRLRQGVQEPRPQGRDQGPARY